MRKICLIFLFVLIFSATVKANQALETLGEAIIYPDGYLFISGIGLTDESWDEILLYVEGTEIYDLRTGFAMDYRDIYEGDCVRVLYESDTDQAILVYVHADEPNTADFMVVASDNIWYSDEGCFFVTKDGKYSIILESDTLLLDRFGYEISFDDITPGTEMFVWASFVTASVPGQVFPNKVVMIN